MPRSLRPLPEPPSRTELVADAVRNAILGGVWPPGHALNERDIAVELGVSKTPVREALIRLQRSGLVTVSTYKGARVREIDARWVGEVCEFRLILEPEAVARAVEEDGATAAAARAGRVLAKAIEAGESARFAELSVLNRDFHRELYLPMANRLVVDTLDNLRDQIAFLAVATWRTGDNWEIEAREHEAILAAFEEGKADRTRTLLIQHLTGFRDRLTRMVESGDGTAAETARARVGA